MARHNTTGSEAEKLTAKYLQKKGFKIIERNWKTKWCEIDIVTKKDGCIYFVEVKFRGSDEQGSGFEYITPKKLRQMAKAAELWVAVNDWQGEYALSAAEVESEMKLNFIEEI